jgi:hypothetical protein
VRQGFAWSVPVAARRTRPNGWSALPSAVSSLLNSALNPWAFSQHFETDSDLSKRIQTLFQVSIPFPPSLECLTFSLLAEFALFAFVQLKFCAEDIIG